MLQNLSDASDKFSLVDDFHNNPDVFAWAFEKQTGEFKDKEMIQIRHLSSCQISLTNDFC